MAEWWNTIIHYGHNSWFVFGGAPTIVIGILRTFSLGAMALFIFLQNGRLSYVLQLRHGGNLFFISSSLMFVDYT